MPTLDELARDPHAAHSLPRPVAAALLPTVLQVVGALLARLTNPEATPADPGSTATSDEPEWITADKVEFQFSLDRDWLEDHAPALRERGIVAAPSRKTRLYHVKKLRRFIEASRVP